MIADLKPYANYKDSGLPWLGQIPEHWVIKRAKSIFECVDKRSQKGAEELLTVSSARGIVPRRTAKVTMFKAESYAGHKLCWPNDLVVNSLWAWGGGLGVSKHHGIVSTAYSVYRIRKNAPILPGFVHEVVRSSNFNWELMVRSRGVWISRLQLTDISFLDAPFYIPAIDEQAAIVKFLDWANGRLENTIRSKRKVISLLAEQKQAIIHRAITRGVSSTTPLKSSDLPWLKELPESWDVRKIKFLVKTVGGMTPSKANLKFWDGAVAWVSPKDMKVREIYDSKDHITERALLETSIALVRPPAVLIVVRGMILARTFPVALTKVPVTLNQDMKALIPSSEIDADYFVHLITGIRSEILKLIEESGHGTKCLRTDSWANFSIPLPSIKEQLEICEYLKTELAGVSSASSRLENEIELLREYRTRLISDVVTGKLDVREAASKIPDDELESTIEPDDLSDDVDEESDELAESNS